MARPVKAGSSTAPANLAIFEQAVLGLCKQHPDGVPEKVLEEELPDLSVYDRAQAINSLLQKKELQILKHGNTLVYKEVDQEEVVKFKGLGQDDILIYQIIQQAGNTGIWTRDMKFKSNLSQPQVTKAIKNLETRRLIKDVKTIAGKNKKVYMLVELEPSRDITGGAWYTEQEFDAEFISILREQSLQHILKEGPVTLESIANAVRRSGITKVDLRVEDYLQVVNTLVFDQEVDAVVSTGGAKDSGIPAGTVYYKVCGSRVPESTSFTSIPCGVCPVIHMCTEDGVISPKTCVYFQEWLQF